MADTPSLMDGPAIEHGIPEPGSYCCRICYDGEVDDDEMLIPCQCAGSMSYVHRGCLDEWRKTSFEIKAISHCTLCGFEFRIEDASGRVVEDTRKEVPSPPNLSCRHISM